jgi:mRNA-degrading endonuclease RelE of RelBE toxin-antitoxin system
MHEILDTISKDPDFKSQLEKLDKDEKEAVNTYIFELSEKLEKIIDNYSKIVEDPEQSKLLIEIKRFLK